MVDEIAWGVGWGSVDEDISSMQDDSCRRCRHQYHHQASISQRQRSTSSDRMRSLTRPYPTHPHSHPHSLCYKDLNTTSLPRPQTRKSHSGSRVRTSQLGPIPSEDDFSSTHSSDRSRSRSSSNLWRSLSRSIGSDDSYLNPPPLSPASEVDKDRGRRAQRRPEVALGNVSTGADADKANERNSSDSTTFDVRRIAHPLSLSRSRSPSSVFFPRTPTDVHIDLQANNALGLGVATQEVRGRQRRGRDNNSQEYPGQRRPVSDNISNVRRTQELEVLDEGRGWRSRSESRSGELSERIDEYGDEELEGGGMAGEEAL